MMMMLMVPLTLRSRNNQTDNRFLIKFTFTPSWFDDEHSKVQNLRNNTS
jgi:hypothetical protein